MAFDYESKKQLFYDSILGTPYDGLDIYFDGKDHRWGMLPSKQDYQMINVFVGNPIVNDWSTQLVYLPKNYNIDHYYTDRGF